LSGSGCALPYAWADIPLCGGRLIPVYLPFLIFFAGANIYINVFTYIRPRKNRRSACTIFNQEIEDRRRLGNKNKQVYFVLLSACTIFDLAKQMKLC
jgi:hypothetical protein